MLRHFYSIVSFLVLLTYSSVLANEGGPRPLVSNVDFVTEKTDFPSFRLSTPELLGIAVPERRDSGRENARPDQSPAAVSKNVLTLRSSPPTLSLPAPVYSLVWPWLAMLISRDLTIKPAPTMPALQTPPPLVAETHATLPRLEQTWRVTPTGQLAQRYDGLTIDGGTDLGLEVRAGSTKKDRATNTIKGTASTQVSLLPDNEVLHRFGQYLTTLKMDDTRAAASHGQLRMVLTSNGAYALNPNTKTFTSTGEVVGTVSWSPNLHERFMSDPWRLVAFRWAPSVSWEGRSLLATAQTAATTRAPTATLTGNLRGDLRLDFLSPQLVASGQYHYGQQLTNTPTTWELATVSWKYQLNGQVSLGGSFAQGMRGPSLPTERELKLEMGVTF